MPGDDLPFEPITLDVNGTVAVRARGQDADNRMELALTGITCRGEPVRVVVNRAYLTRAARLGFERLCLFGDKQPIMATDDRRRYVWAVLDTRSYVEPTEHMTRIESPAPGRAASVDPPHPATSRSNNTPIPRSTNNTANGDGNGKAQAASNGHANGNGHARPETDNGQTSGAIEQVIALRTTLREAAVQATELVRLLKAEKRQNRQLRTALSSLRELQPLEI